MIYKILSSSKDDRSQEDVKILKEYFSNTQLFKDIQSELPAEKVNQLYTELKLESYKKHQTIFSYGDPSSKYYIILQGSCYILIPNEDTKNQCIMPKSNEEQQEIDIILQQNLNLKLSQVLQEGQIIGQIPFNQKLQRTQTVICRENTYVACINSDAYYYIVEKYFSSLVEEKVEFLRKFPFLSVWSNHHLATLLPAIKIKEYTKNQIVFKKSDPVQFIYLIRSGEFEIIQDIEANEDEEPEQAIEQYKQSIEEFYESFNQLNIQFNRSKKQELKKQSRIAILGSNQSFGINEIAQNIPKRLTTAICTSIKAEVFIIEKQIYFNSIKDKQNYEDFIKEDQLKQTWRKKQIENQKNLFQKFEYRKYNIQTNKSVKQMKGFFDIVVENSQQNILENQNQLPQKENNLQQQINSARQSNSIQSTRQLNSILSARHCKLGQNIKQTTEESMVSPKGSDVSIKLQGLSLHKMESQPKNIFMNKEFISKRGLEYKDKQSLSMRLGSNEQNKQQKENNYFQQQRIQSMCVKNNNQIIDPAFNFKYQNFTQSLESNERYNQISSQISPKQNSSTNIKSQRNILTSILQGSIIDNFKNKIHSQRLGQNENIQINENTNNNQSHKQLIKKLVDTPKKFYEEEIFNKLSINSNENTQKIKRRQTQKYNNLSLNAKSNNLLQNSQSFNEKQLVKTSLIPLQEKFIEYNGQNTQQSENNMRKRKKSQEAIRSFKISSSQEIQKIFQNKGETDRYQQMVQIENQMEEQFGRQQTNSSLDGSSQIKDQDPSSQSLKCFEKTFSDAQAVMKKRSFLDSLSQKQYFNQIRKSLNINRDSTFTQIVKRASIEQPLTIPVFQRIQSASSNSFTPVNKTSAKLSVFFPVQRESIIIKPNSQQDPQELENQGKQNLIEQSQFNKDLIAQNEQIQQNQFISKETIQVQQIKNDNQVGKIELNQLKSEETESQIIHISQTSLNQDQCNEIKQQKEPSLSTFGQKMIQTNRFTQTNIQKLIDEANDLRPGLNSEGLNKQDKIIISSHQPTSKQHIKISMKSPLGSSGRITSLCSLKNEDIQQSDQNQLLLQNKKKQNSKPFVVDYNFVDSAIVSKHQKNKQTRNIQTSSQAFSALTIENQEQISPLKYKKVLQIECEEAANSSKTPVQQLQQGNINLTLSQTNQSTSNTVKKQGQQDYFKAQTPSNNGIHQFDNNDIYQQSEGPSPIVRIKSKSSSTSSRQQLMKKDEIKTNIKQNRNTFNSNQKQFLYQLLNRNQIGSQVYESKQNLSNSGQQQSKNLSQSYYRTSINKQVFCAYSSPRQLVFKHQNKQTNNSNTNNSGQVDTSFDKKKQNQPNISLNN